MIELFLFQSICFGAEWFSLINLIDEKSIFFQTLFRAILGERMNGSTFAPEKLLS